MIPMDVTVDTRSPVPHYEQIRSQISRLVLTGGLPEGTRLPSIRLLASQLGISNGAVARAYRELEQEGTVVTAGKRGTTVSGRHLDAEVSRRDRDQLLAEAAAAYGATAHALGFTVEQAVTGLKNTMYAGESS